MSNLQVDFTDATNQYCLNVGNMGISLRQVQRYPKQLSDQNLIVREGGRKNGVWKILDDEYEGFFNRI